MEGNMENKCEQRCSPMHWACCLLPILAGLAWAVAVISAVSAWWKTQQGIDATTCYWNALVFGVLALYGHRARMGSCRTSCGGGHCCSK